MFPAPENKGTPQPDDPEQSKRFIDTAREVEADESPEAFERAFEAVVKAKKTPPKPEASHPRRSAKPASA